MFVIADKIPKTVVFATVLLFDRVLKTIQLNGRESGYLVGVLCMNFTISNYPSIPPYFALNLMKMLQEKYTTKEVHETEQAIMPFTTKGSAVFLVKFIN
jgi:predicted transcriptional regulator YheO